MSNFLLAVIIFHSLNMSLYSPSYCRFSNSKLIARDLHLLHILPVVSASLADSFKVTSARAPIGLVKPKAFVLIVLAWGVTVPY